MTSEIEVKCKQCNKKFEARVADRKRGWAIFCSKSCKGLYKFATGKSGATRTTKKQNAAHRRYARNRRLKVEDIREEKIEKEIKELMSFGWSATQARALIVKDEFNRKW